ncbi:MAG: dihydroorotate dehydrogenase [Desulfobacteraceae bacterium]|jgi:dihydroorotate dehydrogenase (NAD+) catalytic subunit
MDHNVDLSVDVGGVVLKNPVMTASGTFGYGIEFKDYVDLNKLGGIVVKGLSIEPSKGNPPPRIVETACGMLNAIGLENIGIRAFVKDKIPELSKLQTPVFINVYGKTEGDYVRVAEIADEVPAIAGMEINISCPNVSQGGLAFGVDPCSAASVVKAVRSVTRKPLMVKLTPNVTDITVVAKSVVDAGADSLSLINTITGMAIDLKTRKPKLANKVGGLSGPAIKPVALRMVWQVANAVSVPVVGMGGIMNAEDALEFIVAGATAVQIGTANFVNPSATLEIVEGMTRYLKENNISSIKDLRGSLIV